MKSGRNGAPLVSLQKITFMGIVQSSIALLKSTKKVPYPFSFWLVTLFESRLIEEAFRSSVSISDDAENRRKCTVTNYRSGSLATNY
jgi:hypothetical protein